MRLLSKAPGSVLWLLEGEPLAKRNLRAKQPSARLAPERLIFAPIVRRCGSSRSPRHADLFLDTLPHNAHTTASDALWAGVPVLTCLGATFRRARRGEPAQGGRSPRACCRRASRTTKPWRSGSHASPNCWAGSRPSLAHNRLKYPLFDTERYTRNLEAAFIAMHERYRRGLPPDRIAIPAPI